MARPLDAVSDYSALFPQALVISTGVELRMAPNCRVPTGIRHGSGAIGVDLFHGVDAALTKIGVGGADPIAPGMKQLLVSIRR